MGTRLISALLARKASIADNGRGEWQTWREVRRGVSCKTAAAGICRMNANALYQNREDDEFTYRDSIQERGIMWSNRSMAETKTKGVPKHVKLVAPSRNSCHSAGT